MVFSSHTFLFLFLPLVLLINRVLPLKFSNVFLLVVSLLFYGLGEGLLVLLLIISIAWNYVFGWAISHKNRSRWLIGLGVSGNLLVLAYYKYFEFLVGSSFLGSYLPSSSYSDIVLPIGISFFTFQGISYLVDVYRNTTDSEKNPVKLGLYIAFFPQLIAGPIVKYNEFAPYLSKRYTVKNQAYDGSCKFIRGIAKKVIIADNLALVADQIFATAPENLPMALAWLGVLIYSLQIYYDFSGYSDMAIGLAAIMGFHIPENFNYPYVSKSLREFWRRWHISLSSWFKNYLYLPLGGNRRGVIRTYFNLATVFFLTGLWHGASWNFVIWGMLHGVFMIAERIIKFDALKLPAVIKQTYLLVTVGIAWIFFRLDSFSSAMIYIKQLFSFSNDGDWYAGIYLNAYFYTLLVLAMLFATPLRKKLCDFVEYNLAQKEALQLSLYSVMYIGIVLCCWTELTISSYSPFIYFKF